MKYSAPSAVMTYSFLPIAIRLRARFTASRSSPSSPRDPCVPPSSRMNSLAPTDRPRPCEGLIRLASATDGPPSYAASISLA